MSVMREGLADAKMRFASLGTLFICIVKLRVCMGPDEGSAYDFWQEAGTSVHFEGSHCLGIPLGMKQDTVHSGLKREL